VASKHLFMLWQIKKIFIGAIMFFCFLFPILTQAITAVPVIGNKSDNFGLDSAYQVTNMSSMSTIGKNDPLQTTALIINYVLSFLGIVFFGLMLFGGFKWMTAMGRSEETEKAKTILETAIVGIVIVVAGYAITYFILQQYNLTV